MAAASALLTVPLAIALVAGPSAPDAEVELTFHDPEIVESSGLVMTDELAVTVNDSGDSARIFTVDRATGKTVGVTRWEGEARDIEALAPAGPDAVWVGDIGDNRRSRDSITVTRVPIGRGDRSVVGESYEFVYADGPRDAEALAVDPETGRLHLVSKEVFGGTVYRAPKHLDATAPNVLKAVADAPGLVTDAAWTPDGARLLVRNYGQLVALDVPGFDEVGRMTLPAQQQGEGLAVDPDGEVFVSSEGVDSDVLRIVLSEELTAREDPTAAEEDPSGAGNGAPTTTDAPEGTSVDDDPERWPWLLGTGAGVVALVVLVRSLRPR